ncbi:MAG: rRNA maturation RNase YbeY [Planctomycetota bacterium]
MIAIEVTNEQTSLPVDENRLSSAVRMILDDASIPEAQISLAVLDDPTIHRLNREFLNHDEATDVLSFVLERSERFLEGEIVVSADTARRAASRFGWTPADELLLYVIHGVLHLVGLDDRTPDQRTAMRNREREYLARFGLQPRYEEQAEKSRNAPSAQAADASRGGTVVP